MTASLKATSSTGVALPVVVADAAAAAAALNGGGVLSSTEGAHKLPTIPPLPPPPRPPVCPILSALPQLPTPLPTVCCNIPAIGFDPVGNTAGAPDDPAALASATIRERAADRDPF